MANYSFKLTDNSSAPFVAQIEGVYWACKAQIMDCNALLNAAEKPSPETAEAINSVKSVSVRRQHWALHQLCDRFAGTNSAGEKVNQLDDDGKKAAIVFMRPMRNQLPDALLGHCFQAGIFGAKGGSDDVSVSEAAA